MKIPPFSKGQKHHKAAIVALSPACRPPPTIAQRKQILQIDGLFRENSQLPKHVVSSTVLTEAMRIFRICFRIPLQADDARGFRYLIEEVNKGVVKFTGFKSILGRKAANTEDPFRVMTIIKFLNEHANSPRLWGTTLQAIALNNQVLPQALETFVQACQEHSLPALNRHI